VVINLATIPIVYLAQKELVNKRAGLIAATLFAVSPTMIKYSRFMWAPHPVPFFIFLSLLFLIRNWKKDNLLNLFLSWINYFIAVAIYPATLFLLPFYLLVFAKSWVKNKLHRPKGRSILTKQYVRSGIHLRSKDLSILPDVNKLRRNIKKILLIFTTGFIVNLPLVYFYSTKVFSPTKYLAYVEPFVDFIASFKDRWINFLVPTNEKLLLPGLTIEGINLPAVLILIFLIAYVISVKKGDQVSRFINGPVLIVSVLVATLLQAEVQTQRLMPFLPLMFLSLAYLADRLLDQRFRTKLVVGVLLITGLVKFGRLTSLAVNSDIKYQTKKFTIGKILASSSLKDWENGINTLLVYTPKDLPNSVYNYHGHAYYYLLYEATGIGFEFTRDGNEIVWKQMNFPEAKNVFLICDGFDEGLESPLCLDYFFGNNPAYKEVARLDAGEKIILFKLEKNSDQ
jgi:4-amino-4-deoxy-L-arabinose transferase-like glycosyltransferase